MCSIYITLVVFISCRVLAFSPLAGTHKRNGEKNKVKYLPETGRNLKMRGKIVGFEVVQRNKQDGTSVNGVNLCFCVSKPNYIGADVVKEWVSASSAVYSRVQPLNDTLIGKTCNIDYSPGYQGKAVLTDVIIDQK